MAYEPGAYWRDLHASREGLPAVGYPTLPASFNRTLYRNAAVAVRRGLAAVRVPVEGGSVLDVGSGTGFWIDFWRAVGAAEVAGVDLVPGAVDSLRTRFPDVELAVADIAAGPPFPGRRFAVVSAMNVLLHITDEDRFRAALSAIASQLDSGGHVVLLEPVAVRRRTVAGREGAHNVVRSTANWEAALRGAELRVVHVGAATYLLSDPVDARTRLGLEARRLWWRSFSRAIRGRERLASAVVPPLAALDRALARAAGPGPSSKCLILRAG